jgi:hypothetical protein
MNGQPALPTAAGSPGRVARGNSQSKLSVTGSAHPRRPARNQNRKYCNEDRIRLLLRPVEPKSEPDEPGNVGKRIHHRRSARVKPQILRLTRCRQCSRADIVLGSTRSSGRRASPPATAPDHRATAVSRCETSPLHGSVRRWAGQAPRPDLPQSVNENSRAAWHFDIQIKSEGPRLP